MHLLRFRYRLIPHYLVSGQIKCLQIYNKDVPFLSPQIDPFGKQRQFADTQTDKGFLSKSKFVKTTKSEVPNKRELPNTNVFRNHWIFYSLNKRRYTRVRASIICRSTSACSKNSNNHVTFIDCYFLHRKRAIVVNIFVNEVCCLMYIAVHPCSILLCLRTFLY